VVAVYELSPAELVSLGRACVTVDTLAAVDGEIAGQGLSVRGSRGQVIPNRMIKLRCEIERILDVQLGSLNLPMPGESEGHHRSPAPPLDPGADPGEALPSGTYYTPPRGY